MKTSSTPSFPVRGIVAVMASAIIAAVAGCGGGGSSAGDTVLNADISLLTAAGAGTGNGGLGRGPSPVALGTAANYVILAEAGITNVPTSAITGNVGLSPTTGAAIAGLGCPEVTGTINTVDAAGPACRIQDSVALTTAVGDKNTAYTTASNPAPDYTELGAGNIGGRNLGPGTYKWSSAVLIPTNVTLTGGPNDVWIFQIAQGLTVASSAQIILAGGALPANVYWKTFSADLGSSSAFQGTIISQTSIDMKSTASIKGRLLAGTAVTLIQNVVGP
jgi:hypothetical protein